MAWIESHKEWPWAFCVWMAFHFHLMTVIKTHSQRREAENKKMTGNNSSTSLKTAPNHKAQRRQKWTLHSEGVSEG